MGLVQKCTEDSGVLIPGPYRVDYKGGLQPTNNKHSGRRRSSRVQQSATGNRLGKRPSRRDPHRLQSSSPLKFYLTGVTCEHGGCAHSCVMQINFRGEGLSCGCGSRRLGRFPSRLPVADQLDSTSSSSSAVFFIVGP